jgi:hypothetical protein
LVSIGAWITAAAANNLRKSSAFAPEEVKNRIGFAMVVPDAQTHRRSSVAVRHRRAAAIRGFS